MMIDSIQDKSQLLMKQLNILLEDLFAVQFASILLIMVIDVFHPYTLNRFLVTKFMGISTIINFIVLLVLGKQELVVRESQEWSPSVAARPLFIWIVLIGLLIGLLFYIKLFHFSIVYIIISIIVTLLSISSLALFFSRSS